MSSAVLANPPPDRPRRAFNLTRRFSVLSFVCIGVASVLASILLSRFLTSNLLEHDANILMEVVQSIADVQDTSAYFLGNDTQAHDSRIKEFFVHVGKLPDVLRTNIYALDQQVLWSSDPALIGKYLGPNDELSAALGGKVAVESGVIGGSGDVKPEHLLLRSAEPRFVENYLPVRSSAGGPVIGVVEVYRVPTALFETITRGLRLIWAAALGCGLFLYLMLFWIVRRADRLIEEQSDRLLESETLAVIGEMTAAITHGIRNPLASIRTSAELLQDDASTAAREAAGDITAEVDRLSEWVRQLLTYSAQEPARLEAVPLAPLLRSSVAGFEREMQRRGVQLDLAIDAALPPVRGEQVRLSHALNSLLSNALEAMPGGGRLTVAANVAARGHSVQVTIRDSGVGIPREQLARVFAPFFTSKRKGLGLGLPLVNRIVTRFGGAVSIASEPGQWTEVQVELPLHSA
jgi:signal transduction histidine kinase